MFPASDRVISQLRKEVRDQQERRAKARLAKLRRAQRRQRNHQDDGNDAELAFVQCLVDSCPRCGECFEGYPDEEFHRSHLLGCNDVEVSLYYKNIWRIGLRTNITMKVVFLRSIVVVGCDFSCRLACTE